MAVHAVHSLGARICSLNPGQSCLTILDTFRTCAHLHLHSPAPRVRAQVQVKRWEGARFYARGGTNFQTRLEAFIYQAAQHSYQKAHVH